MKNIASRMNGRLLKVQIRHCQRNPALKNEVAFFRRALSLFLLAIVTCAGCAPNGDRETTPVISSAPSTTFPMPPIKGTESIGAMGWSLIQGSRETVGNFGGKVLILDFFATWCLPCRESIPHLIELKKRYSSQGLAIVGLNVGGPEDRDAIPSFVQEFKIDYSVGIPEQPLTDLLLADSDAIPQTFVFDQKGQLIRRYVGYNRTVGHELENTVVAALTAK
jgi:thiol-disulfide isomerase/thioredoxin